MTTPEELDALQERANGLIDFHEYRGNMGTAVMLRQQCAAITTLRARVAELEARERMIVSHATGGANDGAAMAVNEIAVEITKARNLAFIAGKTTAEADLARLRQGVQVKPLTEATVERLRHDLQFIVDTIVKDKVEVSEAYPRLFAVLQQRRAEIGNLGGVQVFGEIARDLLQLMDGDHRAALVSPGEVHSDDLAVDRFAAAMKAKLARKRAEGRGGWEGPDCTAEFLSRLLREHVEKGDPLDVGNLAMMLHQRGERIVSPGDGCGSRQSDEWHKGYAQGYVTACGLIVALHDEPFIAAEVLNQETITWPEIEAMDLAEYDMESLRKIFQEPCLRDNKQPAPPASEAALVSPGDGWTPPPEDQRPEGYRCLALIEVEWTKVFKGGLYQWQRPVDQRMYRVEEGAPGTHGFLPIPAPPASEGGA